jgi:glutathione S-transferase
VWLLLEEKRIPYKVEKVPLRCYGNKPSSFLKINPAGGLPVAVIDGKGGLIGILMGLIGIF